MKKTQIIIAALVLAATLSSQTNAMDSASAQFLKLGAGARAAAMGDAFTSVANDVTSAYWNPAGLARVNQPEVSFMQNSSLLDTTYQYAGGAFPSKNHTIALSVYRMDYGSIEKYSAADVRNGSFNANSLAAAFSVGTKISDNFSWGLSAKLIQESIEAEKASSFAGDLGLMYQNGDTSFGASVQHLGAGLKFVQEKGDLPQTVRAGVSRTFFEKKLQAAFDLSKPKDNDMAFHLGVEYATNDLLTLRGGYQATPGNSLSVGGLTGVSGGLGLNFKNFSVDYAFVPFGDLGNSQRISLIVRFSSNR